MRLKNASLELLLLLRMLQSRRLSEKQWNSHPYQTPQSKEITKKARKMVPIRLQWPKRRGFFCIPGEPNKQHKELQAGEGRIIAEYPYLGLGYMAPAVLKMRRDQTKTRGKIGKIATTGALT
jgi:hypothetical protein